MCRFSSFFFFFNDTATTEIYTLSLHDALPICRRAEFGPVLPESRPLACLILELRQIPRAAASDRCVPLARARDRHADRKSTRLNSSHLVISYAVFCLKKKKNPTPTTMSYHSLP